MVVHLPDAPLADAAKESALLSALCAGETSDSRQTPRREKLGTPVTILKLAGLAPMTIPLLKPPKC